MIPTILQLGPFPIHSFGLSLALAFVAAWYSLAQLISKAGFPWELAERMVTAAAIGGIVGARLFYFVSFPEQFLADPIGAIFSGAGFVFYGGLFGGAFAVWLVTRKGGYDYFALGDLSGPALLIGYGIGRIGCQLSGDGDYGSVSSLPWAMGYPLGVVPTEAGVLVHPTPVYETVVALLAAYYLLRVIRNGMLSGRGQCFGLYLVLAAVPRFLVEIVRIEPRVLWGLTQAQCESVVILCVGAWLLLRGRSGVLQSQASLLD